MKRLLGIFLALALCLCGGAIPLTVGGEAIAQTTDEKTGDKTLVAGGSITAGSESGLNPDCKSAVLMEAATGKILYEKNGGEALPPASVTKVMTLLLVMEEIDGGRLRWSDTVTASAHASSMGGSQIYLKEGETMTVEDMVKSVVIASANDCAVALAEHIAGSEEAFVAKMNRRAEEIGMQNTHFENTNGLDDTAQNHVTSAYDIALMSRALMTHESILKYSSTWMDSVRGGTFGLTNTNRLVRYYQGCNGLKTGSTAKAGFCISASAARDGMTLICVIMGSPSRDVRNAAAVSLLDWGFSQYTLWKAEEQKGAKTPILSGVVDEVVLRYPSFCAVLPKGDAGKVTREIELPEKLSAPLAAGEAVGSVIYRVGEKEIGRVDICVEQEVKKIDCLTLWRRLLMKFLLI